MAGLHDTTHSPAALYQFQGDVLDSSGNGLDLSQFSGTTPPTFGEFLPGFMGLATGVGSGGAGSITRYSRTVADAALAITSDISIGILVSSGSPGSDSIMVGYGIVSTSAVENVLWRLLLDSGDNTLSWNHESGTNVSQTFTSTIAVFGAGIATHLYAVRESNVVKFYVNGRLLDTSGTMTAAASGGGANNRLCIAGTTSNTSNYCATTLLTSLKIVASALSAAQVLAEYNRTLGLIYPALSP